METIETVITMWITKDKPIKIHTTRTEEAYITDDVAAVFNGDMSLREILHHVARKQTKPTQS